MKGDHWVSKLQLNNEGFTALMLGIAGECHEFALSRGIPSHSVEDQLPLVFGVFDGDFRDLLDIREVPTRDASGLASVSIGFSPEGYRRAAEAAKNRVANPIDVDRGGVV
ncbi:hypothetical protein [Roseovarius mucosus]|uniref:hypothetical protein n=1 Tax=Roseovarius mucosus TaxID=215743 RepID=UPI0035D09554